MPLYIQIKDKDERQAEVIGIYTTYITLWYMHVLTS